MIGLLQTAARCWRAVDSEFNLKKVQPKKPKPLPGIQKYSDQLDD